MHDDFVLGVLKDYDSCDICFQLSFSYVHISRVCFHVIPILAAHFRHRMAHERISTSCADIHTNGVLCGSREVPILDHAAHERGFLRWLNCIFSGRNIWHVVFSAHLWNV